VADLRNTLKRFLSSTLNLSQNIDDLFFRFSSLRRPVLVLFGGGSPDFHAAAQRLAKQARSSKRFGKIYAFTEESIPGRREFYARHEAFIVDNSRGFGLWIWKPYIINWVQRRESKNKIIIYLDAGVYLNLATISASKRFDDYLRIAWKDKVMAFQLKDTQYAEQGFPDLKESTWNRSDLLDHLDISERQRQTNQIEAGVIFFRNTKETQDFTKEWLQLMEQDNYEFLREPSPVNQADGFIEHRFDQAVFSALFKSRCYQPIAAENWFHPEWLSTGTDFPFWSVRLRRG
jgi:hypothetical protein